MSARRSIEIAGLSHRTPIPAASRVGPLLASSVIAPFNPDTRQTPSTATDQFANIFRHAGLILAEAGGDWRHIVKMEFWVPDAASRPALDPIWLAHFPKPESRPARHTHVGQTNRISASFLAWIDD